MRSQRSHHRIRRGPWGEAAGFTLIEVLVATAVLALGLIGALAAFSLATRAAGACRNDTIVPMLAEQKLSEVKSVPRDELAAGASHGGFGAEYPQYSWDMRISPPDEVHVVTVELTIHAPEMGHIRDIAFATRIF